MAVHTTDSIHYTLTNSTPKPNFAPQKTIYKRLSLTTIYYNLMYSITLNCQTISSHTFFSKITQKIQI